MSIWIFLVKIIFYLEIQDNRMEEQTRLNKEMVALSHDLSIPLVATNDVHYLKKDDCKAHDALLCIQTQSMLSDQNRMRFSTDQLYFKSCVEMEHSFREIPEALANTVKISERCNSGTRFWATAPSSLYFT